MFFCKQIDVYIVLKYISIKFFMLFCRNIAIKNHRASSGQKGIWVFKSHHLFFIFE